jgi:heat shock protein HslJ
MSNTTKTILLITILVLVALAVAGITGLNDDGQLFNQDDNQEETSIVIDEDLVTALWQWEETIYNNDDVVVPNSENAFIAQFDNQGQFASTTDCNNVMGSYVIEEPSSLSFGPLAATRKACLEETQEQVYTQMLADITQYMIDEEGRLVLLLQYDSGSMIFSPFLEMNQVSNQG